MGHVAGLSQSVKLLPGRTRRGGGQAAGAILRPSDCEGTVRALGASEGYSCWYGSVALKVLHARMRDQSAARAMAMAVPGRPYLRSLISHGDWDDGPAEGEFDGIEAVAFRSGGDGAEEFEDFV